MSLYRELKQFEDIIKQWTDNQSRQRDSKSIERVNTMFKIFETHTGLDMSCKGCGSKNMDRVSNWFNKEKKKFQERGAKRKKK